MTMTYKIGSLFSVTEIFNLTHKQTTLKALSPQMYEL